MIIKPASTATSYRALKALFAAEPGLRVGLTSGSFDLVHDFHLRYLMRCRRQCDFLIVGVDSDIEVQRRKGAGRPVQSEFQRVMLVNSFAWVEAAYIQDNLQEFTEVASLLGERDRVFRNQDFEGRENQVATGESKAKVVIIPDIRELDSTTALMERIKNTGL